MRKMVAAAVLAVAALSGPALAGDEADAKRTVTFEWRAPFADMSPQGMALVREAMRHENIPANAEEVRKARARVLDLLAAEKLDVEAIRKAQAAERAVAIREHALAQEKLLKAYQQLSVADRRAFVDGMRMQEERMLRHMERARARMIQVEQQMRNQREQMRREMEQMRRDIERVKRDAERVRKETGSLWIVVPPHEVPPPAAEPAQLGKG
jgi:hypothetical protein